MFVHPGVCTNIHHPHCEAEDEVLLAVIIDGGAYRRGAADGGEEWGAVR
jgi:hypothetical protein